METENLKGNTNQRFVDVVAKKYNPGDNFTCRIPNNVDKEILEWLNTQSNMSQSLIALIKNYTNANGINNLSHNPNQIPSGKEITPYVLECIANDHSKYGVHVSDIYNYCQIKLNVSAQQRSISSKANDSLFENRIRFVLLKLKQQKLIQITKRGFYKIDTEGLRFINMGYKVDNDDRAIEAFEAYRLAEKL